MSFKTLTLDGAPVEVYQVTGEGKTDTCPEGGVLTVFSVIETGEEVFHLIMGDSCPVVANPDNDLVIAGISGYIDSHFSLLSRIFHRIRQ